MDDKNYNTALLEDMRGDIKAILAVVVPIHQEVTGMKQDIAEVKEDIAELKRDIKTIKVATTICVI